MLQLASRTLQRFLASTVPPPAPDARPEGWVRIGEVADLDAVDRDDTLVLQLYCVEQDPHSRSAVRASRGADEVRALLDLHYVISYTSSSQESREAALGGVLRAFRTRPVLRPRDYLSEPEFEDASSGGLTPERLEVSLEDPDPERVGALWHASPTGSRLALYYLVRALPVPPYLDLVTPTVEHASFPAATPMDEDDG